MRREVKLLKREGTSLSFLFLRDLVEVYKVRFLEVLGFLKLKSVYEGLVAIVKEVGRFIYEIFREELRRTFELLLAFRSFKEGFIT